MREVISAILMTLGIVGMMVDAILLVLGRRYHDRWGKVLTKFVSIIMVLLIGINFIYVVVNSFMGHI